MWNMEQMNRFQNAFVKETTFPTVISTILYQFAILGTKSMCNFCWIGIKIIKKSFYLLISEYVFDFNESFVWEHSPSNSWKTEWKNRANESCSKCRCKLYDNYKPFWNLEPYIKDKNQKWIDIEILLKKQNLFFEIFLNQNFAYKNFV